MRAIERSKVRRQTGACDNDKLYVHDYELYDNHEALDHINYINDNDDGSMRIRAEDKS